MGNADAHAPQRRAAAARWGNRVLRRSAETVLERAEVSGATRDELERIARDVPQNEAWAQAFRSQKQHREEHARSVERVDRMLLEAELKGAVQRRDIPAVMGLIERLSRHGPAEAR